MDQSCSGDATRRVFSTFAKLVLCRTLSFQEDRQNKVREAIVFLRCKRLSFMCIGTASEWLNRAMSIHLQFFYNINILKPAIHLFTTLKYVPPTSQPSP